MVEIEFAEFSRSNIYRQLATARLESYCMIEVGTMPESHARAILEVLDRDEDKAIVVHEVSRRLESPTAEDYRRLAKLVWLEANGESKLQERAAAGELPVSNAYEIGRLVTSYNNEPIASIARMCNDPELVRALYQMEGSREEGALREIVFTRSIPGYESVPLDVATIDTLKAYLSIDSAENRARYVEHNRHYYDRLREIHGEIIKTVRLVLAGKKELGNLARLLEELDNHEGNANDNLNRTS